MKLICTTIPMRKLVDFIHMPLNWQVAEMLDEHRKDPARPFCELAKEPVHGC
jgi:hypothetical protein